LPIKSPPSYPIRHAGPYHIDPDEVCKQPL
jgi:hypothetical protein